LTLDLATERLARFFMAAAELTQVMCRATGNRQLGDMSFDDLTTFKRGMADLAGVAYGGVSARQQYFSRQDRAGIA
jgi:hypothetical protein